MKRLLNHLALLMIVIVLVTAGCATAPPNLQTYARPEADFSSIKRIAVFPFEALNPDEFSGERIRRLVIAEFLNKGYEIIEPGEVLSVMTEMLPNRSLAGLSRDDITKVSKKLNADAVVTGAVETYRMSSGVTVPYPDVSISLRLLSSSSGDILWSAAHTSGGPNFWTRHFGSEGITLSEAAKKVVHEAIQRLP
ncbi:MAG: DUF799 family lipoprotein [Thermodesulfovibrionales bacterium]